MLSVIVPNWNCDFVTPTIHDLLAKAAGEIEIIVPVDDQWPKELVHDKRVTYLKAGGPVRGLRAVVNAAAKLARGKYLMKTDDHCMFAQGFDKVLIEGHLEDNWVTIPRRYSLDAENWKINETRPYRDYHYLHYPDPNQPVDIGLKGMEWPERTRTRTDPKYDIDDLMSFQGSCWFMTKNHFDNFLHGMDEKNYGTFAQEPQEIGLKTWLGGGRMIINKKTWYAHLHKGKQYKQMARLDRAYLRDLHQGHVFTVNHWMNNLWPDRVYNIEWLVEKFWPIPTWPENWVKKEILIYSASIHNS